MSTHCQFPGCKRHTHTPQDEPRDSYAYCWAHQRDRIQQAEAAGYFQEVPSTAHWKVTEAYWFSVSGSGSQNCSTT